MNPHQQSKLLDLVKSDAAKNANTTVAWIAMISSAIALLAASEASAAPRDLKPNTYER